MMDKGASLDKSLQRESGLELFRIITMLLIVAHHYVVNSGLMSEGGPIYSQPLCGKSIFLLLFGAWGKTGINCFVLITGYFMCTSKITLKKFLKLLLEIYFYRIIVFLVFLFCGYTSLSATGLVKMILPVTSVQSNFTGCYILFFLCIPFLNILIKNISEKQHLYLVGILVLAYTVIGTVPGFGVSMNYVSWFAVLYIIASYIRLYPKKIFNSVGFWGFMAIVSLLVSLASVICCIWLGNRIDRFMPYYFLADSNKILALVTALSAFLFFKNLKFKNAFINTVAASCFGVLLIHANSDAMRTWLWGDFLNNVGMYHSERLVIHAVLSVVGIYIVCTIIDYLRITLLERPFFKYGDKFLQRIAQYYKNKESKLCHRLSIKED